MGTGRLQVVESGNKDVVFCSSGIKFEWNSHEGNLHHTGFFAIVGQAGFGLGISPNPPGAGDGGTKFPLVNSSMKYDAMPETGFQTGQGTQGLLPSDVVEIEDEGLVKKKNGFKLKFKIGNPSLRRLIDGEIAGAVSRTAVVPLETMKTMKTDGWKGLFQGNFVNVIRTPSEAIELFASDKKHLSPKSDEQPKTPIPASSIAGAVAGVSSTLCTCPLELLKTHLTAQDFKILLLHNCRRGLYKNLLDAFARIVEDEGAARNYFVYDTLQKAYKKAFQKEDVWSIMTLLIGSATTGAISSSATFPLEIARKHMQAGALNGRQYSNMLLALISILEKEGPAGAISSSATFPLEVARKLMQPRALNGRQYSNMLNSIISILEKEGPVGAISSMALKHLQAGTLNGRQDSNMLDALISMVEKEGPAGLCRKLGPSCLKLVPAARISFMCYEACKKILVEKEENSPTRGSRNC